MPDPAFTQKALETFLRRAVADGTKTRADLKAMSVDAFAKLSDGTTVVEVTIEGGLTRAQVNCGPDVLMAAVEVVLAETDEENPLGGANTGQRFADFSNGRIET